MLLRTIFLQTTSSLELNYNSQPVIILLPSVKPNASSLGEGTPMITIRHHRGQV
jgi:hypothetical protein